MSGVRFFAKYPISLLLMCMAVSGQAVAEDVFGGGDLNNAFANGALNGNSGTNNNFDINNAFANGGLNSSGLNLDGVTGGSSGEGLKDFYVFGDKLSPVNKGGTSGISTSGDSYAALGTDMSKWFKPTEDSAVAGTAATATGDAGSAVALDAMNPLLNSAGIQADQKFSESMLSISGNMLATGYFAATATDPALARSLEVSNLLGLSGAGALNGVAANYNETTDAYGRQAMYSCLNFEIKNNSKAPMASCYARLQASGGGAGLSNIFSSISGISDFLNGLTGSLKTVGNVIKAVQSGNYAPVLNELGLGSVANTVKSASDFIKVLKDVNFKDYDLSKVADSTNKNDTASLSKMLGLNTRSALGVAEPAKVRAYSSNSAINRNMWDSLLGGFTGGAAGGGTSAGKELCKIQYDNAPSAAKCTAKGEKGISNIYMMFPTDTEKRTQFKQAFGDSCNVCQSGGSTLAGMESLHDGTVTRIAVPVEPSVSKEDRFKDLYKRVYEALRGTMYSMCLHNNQSDATNYDAGVNELFKVSNSSGTLMVASNYDDGEFWRSNAAATNSSSMTGYVTAYEALEYLSFPGVQITSEVMDRLYSIFEKKSPIGTKTSAEWNTECNARFGTSVMYDVLNARNIFTDGKERAKLPMELQGLLLISQAVTAGKFYNACGQALATIDEIKADPLYKNLALNDIYKSCSVTDISDLIEAQRDNINKLAEAIRNAKERLAVDSGKSGSGMARGFKVEKTEAKLAGG